MDSVKYIGMDVHKEAISIAVLNSPGKLVMECIIETKAATIRTLNFDTGKCPDKPYYLVANYSDEHQ
ncbi:MAG: hypothetical protein ACLP3K_10330 [Candidatus Acidiferrales bacterium]